MYLRFFNLRESPFNLTPDPRFLFLSAQHEEALTHLLYGIYERKGFIEITGEVGTGKTVLCRALLERLDKTVSTALIFNSYLTKMELLQAITDEFGLQPGETTSKGYIDVLNEYLLNEFAAGHNAVVVIDEAQNLEPTVLEQLRMLSNLETERVKLLQIILVGQPELHTKLATLQMRQLEQRIAVRFHIHELTRTETEQYLTHRMSVAGAAHTVIWSRRALRLIHHYTGGIPRRINLLCDRVLMTAFVRETHRVSAAIVRRSVQELASPWQSKRMCWLRRVGLGVGAGLGLLGLIVGGVFLLPTVRTQWYPRVVEQVLALTRNTTPPQPASLPPLAALSPDILLPKQQTSSQPASLPPPAALPLSVSEPALPVAPVLATSGLVPPSSPLEIDVGLAQTLWRAKIQAEEQGTRSRPGGLTSWEPIVTNTAKGLGLDVMAWQTSIWQLQSLTRPCFIEVLPEPSASRPELWVLARGVTEGILIYQEPEGLLTVPLQQLRQAWSGKVYLTLEESKYRGFWLAPGMVGERVRILQHTLKEFGYFTSVPSGQFDAQTQQAVKRFQRANQLGDDGRVGRRTLMILLHAGADALALAM
ncbi:MAG TPA: AAA family ATPase [Candidatus Saccharimonadia bacterium]|nr:AAA family ATPase [Candidatus Saccharimonadia bacterium]